MVPYPCFTSIIRHSERSTAMTCSSLEDETSVDIHGSTALAIDETAAGILTNADASIDASAGVRTATPNSLFGHDAQPAGVDGTQVRLAWLTTEYPKASHTFVRREILALEQLGHSIQRFSVRGGGAVVDPADILEASKTTYILKQPLFRHLFSTLYMVFFRPLRFFRAARVAFATWWHSHRGLLRHMAYLVEAATLCRLLHSRQVQHVHVHFGKNAADVARLCWYLGGPTYSMMVHGPGEFDAPASIDLGGKVQDSLFTTPITSYAQAQLQRWTPYADWDRLEVVHCAINDDFLNAGQPLLADSVQFVCIGRLTAQKGQLALLDAVAQVLREGHSVRLVLAGDGEMRSVLEERIASHGIQDAVQITGWIGEQRVRELLLESRAMVLPSFAEGLPVAIMEAFALGRPVISSAITGIPELVTHGKNGWLVIPGSVPHLAAALVECLQTPVPMLNAMGANGRERVRADHLASTEAKKLSAILQRRLANGTACLLKK